MLKPHNNGTWTEARKRSFIISALRQATMKWGPKWAAVDDSFVEKGKNPVTGKPCKLHRCALCGLLYKKGDMKADHIEPVVDPSVGFQDWNTYVERMFVEKEGYQAVCTTCHKLKTSEEREIATARKRAEK